MTEQMIVGHFEQLVLSAVLALGDDAYGVSIYERVRAMGRRDVNLGSLYVTLERLERKGLLKSWFSDPTPERGGRRKRFYRLEPAGEVALNESLEASKRAYEETRKSFAALRAQLDDLQAQLDRQTTVSNRLKNASRRKKTKADQ